jgi:hypothetical protein
MSIGETLGTVLALCTAGFEISKDIMQGRVSVVDVCSGNNDHRQGRKKDCILHLLDVLYSLLRYAIL